MNGCNNCAKRRDLEKECPWGGTYHHHGEHGEKIGICNAYKEETNADRIRAMTDKELAEFIGHNSLCDRIQCEGTWCEEHAVCGNCLTVWLQQPAREGGS